MSTNANAREHMDSKKRLTEAATETVAAESSPVDDVHLEDPKFDTNATASANGGVDAEGKAGEDEIEEEFHVDPWSVSGQVDYTKLCNQFGCDLITQDQIAQFESLTHVRPHCMIRRGLYYAHRDFDEILGAYEEGEPFYLYTGRGPSSESMHLGHIIPFIINKHLMDAFNVPIVIQVTDDEKYFFKNMSLEESHRLARENIKDIIAMGFDVTRTFIFIDTEYISSLYPNVCRVQKAVTFSQLSSIFGLKKEDGINVGMIAYPPIQAVPAFSSTFPVQFGNRHMKCLIPCAVDQDPYFRMTRDVAPKLGEYKCATFYSKFIPPLSGPGGKMSSSAGAAIFLNDSAEEIRRKIMKHCYSGGGATKSEHETRGANLDTDVAYQYLTYFLDDDDELEMIGQEYSSGRMSTVEIKERLCDVIVPLVMEFQENRKKVTDQVVDAFLRVRPLHF